MDKVCLIRQPAGLGDIFFLQKAISEIYNSGFEKIIWPLKDNFLYLTQYIRTPYIDFFSEEEDFPYKDVYLNEYNIINQNHFLYIPFQYADRYIGGSVMEAKYKFINSDFNEWVNHFTFKRDIARENILYYNILKLNDDEEYVLVNKNFGSPPDFLTIKNMQLPTDCKLVEMDFYGLDNIFDWCKVIENARNIHTVETSICYFIEKLDCKATEIHLYSRNREADFNYIKNIFTKNYKYYEGRCI
jgi:hypothetical protein